MNAPALGAGRCDAILARDNATDAGAIQMDRTSITRTGSLTIDLRSASGCVGRFVRPGSASR